jgi:hypothetical protein
MPIKSGAKQRFENLVAVRQLKNEPGNQDEIDGLIASAKPRLKDAGNSSLSLESRFDLAYNAAHSLALAALRWHGYRSENRYTVFQCLPDTLGLEISLSRVLDDAHRKRNNAEYSGVVDINQSTVEGVIQAARKILELISNLGRIK